MESLLLPLLNMKLDGCLARIVSVQYPLNRMMCEQQSQIQAGVDPSNDDV
jgi:hypothetical protein